MTILQPFQDAHAQVKSQRTPEDEKVLEQKKLFRLKYIQEIAQTAVIVAKAFMNAILSLVSGVVAAVSAVFQVRKMVLTGKKEIKELKAEAGAPIPGRPQPMANLKVETKTGGAAAHVAHVKTKAKAKHAASPKPVPIATTAVPVEIPKVPGFQFDSGTLTFIISLAVFVVLRFVGKKPKTAETPRS